MSEKEPTPTRDEKSPPLPTVPDGPREIEDAAAQELEYPEDDTNEG
jgi:hypothetical protein